MKRNKPKINNLTNVENIDVQDEIEGIKASHFIDEKTRISQRFMNCCFDSVTFLGKYEDLDFVDVVFDHCDLSNLDFSRQRFLRVEFNDCKMSGVRFYDGLLEDVCFKQCLLTYASFDQVRLKRVFLKECLLKESMFYDLNMKYCCFERCELQKSEWLKIDHKNLDLSDSHIEDIRIDQQSLKGMVVSAIQAIELSRLLGIIIK